MPVAHRLLMCPPTHFAVDYEINPWMRGQLHQADRGRAQAQWDALAAIVGRLAAVETVAPATGLPDMPFAANAGLVLEDAFVPSRFRHAERQGEEALFTAWFTERGYRIVPLPAGIDFEGAGDALFDRGLPRLLWMGHGHRSDAEAAPALARLLDVEVVPLRLVDPRFYHLDTCFCPLRGGWLLYFPEAFDDAARARIEARVPAAKRIVVGEEDALAFACNAVNLGDAVILNRAGDALKSALSAAGFEAVETPLDEFLKAGGSAKCLTLRLDEPPVSA
ncbi:MAG: arginine deiminase-related protein [Pseudoxanthomonas sp.]